MQLRIDDVAFQVDTGLSFGKEIAGGSIVDMQVGSLINTACLDNDEPAAAILAKPGDI
jgi:hypothetical protein